MATREDPKKTDDNLDDLLQCTICLEPFKDPKCLPCLHTFCKVCIHTYIDSLKKQKGEIPCPICCKQVLSTNSSDNTDSIVDKLPSNNFVVSLLQKQTISENHCDFCNALGKRNKALFWCGVCQESYCEQCINIHKTNKLLTMHKVVSIEHMQGNTADVNETIILCDDHSERVVEVYCLDHSKACCTLCATLSHRKCDKVISIEEAAAGIKRKSEVTDLLSNLKDLEELLTDVINCRNENEEAFENEATKIETTVTKMIKEMKDHLDKIQSRILSELEAAKKQMSMKVTDDINDFTSYKSAVTNLKRMLAGVVKHGSEQQCLLTSNEIAPKVEKLQAEIKVAMKKVQNASVRFKVSTFAKEFNEKVATIGELKVEESKLKLDGCKLIESRTDFRNGEIKVVRTLNVASSGETCGIFLDHQVIFSARNTQKVIKYDQFGEFLEELLVPSSPTGLCHTSDLKVAVSSYGPNCVYIVDSQHMTLLNTITLVDVPVWGVTAYENDQFLIGCNRQITWVDRSSGAKVNSMNTPGYSIYVLTSGNNDYLYGDSQNSVSYVVNDIKMFTYTNKQLTNPYGNGMDDEGNFWIAGHGSKNIHQINDAGELIRIIPASTVNVEVPWTIKFKKGSNRFLVTCHRSGKASLCCID